MSSAIGRWLEKLRNDYEAEDDDPMVERFASAWRAPGDSSVLLYAAVEHLAAIRRALEAQRLGKEPVPRRR